MLTALEHSRCAKVFFYFEQISKIPHGSGNTDKIADFLVDFANARGLYVRRDGADNVVIKKKATNGYESRPAVIIQGHTDMVEAKTPDCTKDLKTEGLEIYVDGDFLRAHGTTLGADDGIGVAYALAILDSDDVPHPAIEAVFTSDEETGLIGAAALETDDLEARVMLNIDMDNDKIFTAGCAGGITLDITLPMKRAENKEPSVTLTVSGLCGGHSGGEINRGRENAIRLLVSVLSELGDIKIAKISGGNADNAIPRSASATILGIDEQAVRERAEAMLGKYRAAEPSMTVTVEKGAERVNSFDIESTKNLIELIMEEPNGVIAMSADIDGLVETSLNLGIIETDGDAVRAVYSLRSSKDAEKSKLLNRVTSIATARGASYYAHGDYPGWEFKKESHLRKVMCSVYKRMYNEDARVVAIHAGLECGIFAGKLPGLDCVSIGPNNYDLHTTEEHLSISSTEKMWDFIKEVLKNI